MRRFQPSYGAVPATMVQASNFAGPRYDKYRASPGQWWAAAPARAALRAGGGAIGLGMMGYIIGLMAPGVSRQQGAKWGAVAGAVSGAISALVPPSPNQ